MEENSEIAQTEGAPLVIVDVQNGFVNNNSRHVLPQVTRLARHWIDRGWPVYMSQFTNTSGSQWERLLGWSKLEREDEIALHMDLEELAKSAKVFQKYTYTCVTDIFASDLATNDWQSVYLCGIATDGCVLATAIDLFEFDERPIRPIVVEDACASHAGQEVHDKGIHLLQRFIGRDQIVMSSSIQGLNQLAS
jgi:nicotinamidase-related amidase